jgi:indoleamine 2,3-dioxygenase
MSPIAPRSSLSLIDTLESYGITKNGFLPAEPPLTRISNPYYEPWEDLVIVLPQLLKERQIRERVDYDLPLLDLVYLESEPEWQRAYLVLSLIAQAYIWGGDVPSEVSTV